MILFPFYFMPKILKKIRGCIVVLAHLNLLKLSLKFGLKKIILIRVLYLSVSWFLVSVAIRIVFLKIPHDQIIN